MADTNDKQTVTEEDLLKSIKELETPPVAVAAEAAAVPEVKTTTLEKSAAAEVLSKASPELKKSLEVSSALTEIVNLLGAHVDESLSALQKSVQAGAERDLGFIRVLGDLKKSIDASTAKIEEFGTKAAEPKTITTTATDVLSKSVASTEKKVNGALVRKQISDGFEKLAKSHPAGSNESMGYVQAAIKYESANQISDTHLAEIQKLYQTS